MLEDLKVIDAASYVAGPAAATIMGDFGADVTKVEPVTGDSYRGLASRYRTDYNWLLTSRNKKSLALDLSTEQGRQVMLSLVDKADVLLVNFNSDQLRKYQLDYETLKKRNPRLVLGQLTGYGIRGPEANRRSFDIAGWWARSGILDMMKPKGGMPPNGVGGVGDHASAMSLFGAVMLALYRRENTGEGAHVTTSLAANGAWSNGMHLQAAIAGFDLSEILETKGYRSPFIVSYQTRDNRYIVLVGPSPAREWPRVASALGHPEWIDDDRFPDAKAVMSQSDLVKSLFSDAFATQTLEFWTKALDAQEVTSSVIEKLKDVLEDAQLIENEIIIKTESTDPDYQWTVGSPITVEGHTKTTPSTAPRLGQDSRAVLACNGYSEEEIDRLMSLGIIA